jgi:endonuclease/exonuclease/phosphatase family metal-dependent hydrolase
MRRWATYNVQRGIGLDLRRDLSRAARVLHEIEADVVAVQEVTRSPAVDQAAYLAEALGLHLARCEVRPHREGTYGHAVLSRWPIAGCEELDLTVTRRERRRALRVDLAAPDGVVHVFACHFGLSARERRRQIERLAAFVDACPDGRIVMGDFNEWYRGPVAETLGRTLDGVRPPPRTHPAPLPLFPVDRIYWDDAFTGDAIVHRSPLARVASDHLPIVASLRETAEVG